MNIIPVEANDFCLEYCRKNLDKRHKSVGAMLDWSLNMDDKDFKRMMTAYRVAKKRNLDKEKGNEMVNISITKSAYLRLKALTIENGVTLSQYISSIESNNDYLKGKIVDLNYTNDTLLMQLNNIMSVAKLQHEKVIKHENSELDNLKYEIEKLKQANEKLVLKHDGVLLRANELENKLRTNNLELEKAQLKIEQLDGECLNLSNKLVTANNNYSVLKEVNSELKKELMKLKRGVK